MEKQKRPTLLSTLCVMSFIGSGVAFLGYFIASLFFEEAIEAIVRFSSWHTTDKISPLYFTILMALNSFSLIGAIRIWKYHRDGMFIYLIAQLGILFFPSIWVGWEAFSYTNLIFTLIFIGGYFYHFRILK